MGYYCTSFALKHSNCVVSDEIEGLLMLQLSTAFSFSQVVGFIQKNGSLDCESLFKNICHILDSCNSMRLKSDEFEVHYPHLI